MKPKTSQGRHCPQPHPPGCSHSKSGSKALLGTSALSRSHLQNKIKDGSLYIYLYVCLQLFKVVAKA